MPEKERNTRSRHIALELLRIGAIKLNPNKPYTWASGWKSPIYCDNRLSLSFPKVRKLIKDSLVSLIRASMPEAEAIAGVATAGIPQGALVADAMDLPFLYVRSKPKGHGMENTIEGKIIDGQKIAVIEDLISTGGSAVKAVETLRHNHVEVVGLAAIFTYGFPIAEQNFTSANIPYYTLSNYYDLLHEALQNGIIRNDQLEMLNQWRENPEIWRG